MTAQRGRQLEPDHAKTEYATSLKRANVPGDQPPRLNMDGEVMGEKPGLLPRLVVRGQGDVAIQQSLFMGAGF